MASCLYIYYTCMYISVTKMAALGSLDLLSLKSLFLLAQPDDWMRSVTLVHNTKKVQRLTRVFWGRSNWTKNRSDNKMATVKTSLHSAQNCLCYHFAVHPTNESCSQRCLRRFMSIRSLRKPSSQVTAYNVTEVLRKFSSTGGRCPLPLLLRFRTLLEAR